MKMPVALIVQLITSVGLPLALQLIELYQKDPNTVVTPEMWASLKAQIQTPFETLAGPK
jgi:hypothetical protein